MTKFQKCILIFIGEFLVLLGCLVAAVGAPAAEDFQVRSLEPHAMVL